MPSLVVFNGRRRVPHPVNEPIKTYAPGSPERASLKKEKYLQPPAPAPAPAAATPAPRPPAPPVPDRVPAQTAHPLFSSGSGSFFGDKHPEYVSLPKYFKQHGYDTLRTGKIFHGGIDDDTAWTTGGEPRTGGTSGP